MSDSLPIPIIRSKLYQPRDMRDLINRDRLLGSTRHNAGGVVTLVSAPAGYGKSTFVSQCIRASGLSCAWLSLDPADSDIRRFLSYLVAALRTAVPDCCSDTVENLHLPSMPPAEELAGAFCNDLDQIDEPLILALDDYYHISGSDVHELINAILKRPPGNLHTIIITRRDPPLSLQTLRANGVLDEFRMRRLAFTAAESREFVRSSLGDTISEPAIARLHQRTEGWPAALRLAMLAAPEYGSTDDFAEGIPDDIHGVREYLMLEVLAKHTPEVRDYLSRTAFLDRFCAPLVEAVLADDICESTKLSGRDFVGRIRESGLFSIALDSRQEWFRYHHLFQAMLKEQALSDLGRDETRDIHARASRWFEDNDLLEEAISQLVQADMMTEAAALIVRHRNKIMNTEQWHRLAIWLRLLPSKLISKTPELLLLQARFLRTRGDREESLQVLERAAALLETTTIDRELRQELEGSLESSRCYQLYVMSDGPGALDKARRALELLPEDSLAERGFAFIILAGALQMNGDIELARKTLYAAMSDGSGGEGASVTFSSRLLLALDFVQWMDADLNGLAPTAERGSEMAASANLAEALAVSHSFQAAVLYHRNELVAVHDLLQDVTHDKAIANAEFYAQCLIISSLTHQELGNTTDATNSACALHRFALKTQNTFLVAQSEAFNAEIALRQGRMAEALSWADRFDPEPFTPMYVFYSPVMTLAKVLVLEDSETCRGRADGLLNKLVDYLARVHNRRFLIEALALRAMLLDSMGDVKAARIDLVRAVSMAQPSRFIRLFADLGPRLGHLLHGLDLDENCLAYVGEVLAAFNSNSIEPAPSVTFAPVAAQDIGVDPLSSREQQILALLADRLSNKEIANRLNISTVTVKRHAANIYQKLSVHSRGQAVAKAAGLGMFARTG
ncbi:MAG: LuxR C-terminal-related transcriptional regulator [Pseudomonadales bacterium]